MAPGTDDHIRVPSSESGIEEGFMTEATTLNEPTTNYEFTTDIRVDPNLRTPDVNIYQQKKTLAQGMMDLALLSANANQLRYVIEARDSMSYYAACLTFISLSIIIQVAVGVMLIWNSRYNVKIHNDMCNANRINNITVCSVFLVTIINVFISVFASNPASGSPIVAG